MLAHRVKIVIPENHEITLRLPDELPPGAAEIIILSESPVASVPADTVENWLKSLSANVPNAPVIPLEALRRENLYE
jgi:hypothetical protein